jgi:uncharacterized protein YpuA (DUF1002 family)
MTKKNKKNKKKKKNKKDRCRKNMKRKKETQKRRRHSSKHFKPRRQSKTKIYSILKIFEVEGVAVKVEEMIIVVEDVINKGIMRRMGNQGNKIRR